MHGMETSEKEEKGRIISLVYPRSGTPQDPRRRRGTALLLGLALLISCKDATGVPAGAIHFTTLSAGTNHVCAATAGGEAYCWGANDGGQIGLSGGAAVRPTLLVTGPVRFSTVAAGNEFSCGLLPNGTPLCWGAAYPSHQVKAPPLVSLATGSFACGLTSGGAAYCWKPDATSATAVSGGLSFTTLSLGGQACGITDTGETHCWTDPGASPALLGGGLQFTSISVGLSHACGLVAGGTAWCWGDGSNGVLGTGTFGFEQDPVQVMTSQTFTSISAGTDHTCAASTGGTAYCWGRGDAGQLGFGGDPPYASFSIPAPILTGPGYVSITAGDMYTCGMTTTALVYCWGDNSKGQLGDGTLTQRPEPALVLGQE